MWSIVNDRCLNFAEIFGYTLCGFNENAPGWSLISDQLWNN